MWGGRWEGGSGWGTHVNPWLIHVNVWQKPLQYCKVISLQLIKINEKKISDLHDLKPTFQNSYDPFLSQALDCLSRTGFLGGYQWPLCLQNHQFFSAFSLLDFVCDNQPWWPPTPWNSTNIYRGLIMCQTLCKITRKWKSFPLRSSYFTGEAGMYISNYSGVWWVQRGSMVWTFKKQREWDGEHQPVRAREAGISSFRENPSLKYEFKDWKFALQIMWETRHSQKRRDSI